jgi:hypothetical protein
MTCRHSRVAVLVVLLLVPAMATSAARAQVHNNARILPRPMPGGGPGGTVRLPYTVQDGQGNQWMIYQGGWLQQQGNQPTYGQAAVITIAGQGAQSNNNMVRLDDKTGELVFDNMRAGPYTVTRRVLINREEGYVRYVDLIRNPQPQEQQVDVQLQTNVNFGVQAAEVVDDPKRKGQDIAWVAQTQGGRAVAEVYGGRGTKLAPTVNWQQGQNQVYARYSVAIPGNAEVGLMHVHAVAGSLDEGKRFVADLSESRLLRELPLDLRKLIVNFRVGLQLVGERELLRGETFDVVELRGGDQVRGTLKDPSYQLQTFYGPVELPADRVVGLINVGEFRPRQLLVTVDGEVFGGRLGKETVALELTSGQVTQVPLTQVARFGYRKRAGEPEEWALDKPMVVMRSGDRVAVVPPAGPIEVMTRYGRLPLEPATIASVSFLAEDHGVHEVTLTDGSRFSGLVMAPQFEMKLAGTNDGQVVAFPSSGIARLQFAAEAPEPGETDPTLQMAGGDAFVGTLSGQLKLDTAFDTLAVEAAEVRRLAHPPDAAGLDVQVTLWDDTVVSGQLEDGLVPCALKSGLTIEVPVALVEEYNQPEPRPSAGMTSQIQAKVAQLNDDDWRQRDRAEAELIAMGAVVAPVLRELRPTQSPEAQQRIDQVLTAVSKEQGKQSTNVERSN